MLCMLSGISLESGFGILPWNDYQKISEPSGEHPEFGIWKTAQSESSKQDFSSEDRIR